ncbi:hypothetical protein KFE69_02010 [bacterium SCSIO 12844]|nr:hypothetical protein KFE69_02010 [bacterium SCSIO 12844]
MQTASSFFEEELSSINLNDARLNKRAFKIGDNLLSNPGSCIQSLTDDKNEARCPYDFFSNPKVNWMHLLLPHRQSTLQRISSNSSEHIYIIQDSTFYNYTSHTAKVDLGVIGKQGSHIQLGLMQHTSFCVDSNDIPLGILELDFMGYEDSQKYSSHRSDFEAIASSRWRRFVSQNIKELKDNKYKQKVILLCDREADFFELHNDLRHGDLKFIIRCKYINRLICQPFTRHLAMGYCG